MENVTLRNNQAKAADDPMPVPAENNPASADASLTTLTETPAPTEIPAPLGTPKTETLANESAPSRTGWIAYIIWIASTPGRWAFKKINSLLTFGTTLWKVYIVYQVVTAASGFFFPSGNGSSTDGDASIHHPPVVQHFMFAPVEYSYARSLHQFPLSTGMSPQSSLDSYVQGYYEKDAKALRQAGCNAAYCTSGEVENQRTTFALLVCTAFLLPLPASSRTVLG